MELAVGNIYEGKVTGIAKYGAFVSLEGGKSGLVHISEVANTFVSDVANHVKMGQSIKVKVVSIGPDGKINLSIKRVEEAQPQKETAAPVKKREEESPTQRLNSPAKHQKYNMAPIPAANEDSGDINFEDRLKKFMQESDSRIADSRMYSDRKQRSRRR
ncbi:MAG: S1 RNA-binding domain-containing protein [Oscillospiraceae bacterium]|nr:S1 RNA-binding domain-containing protein [Oscillospiraceae bacterium]